MIDGSTIATITSTLRPHKSLKLIMEDDETSNSDSSQCERIE